MARDREEENDRVPPEAAEGTQDRPGNREGRSSLARWQADLLENVYTRNPDFRHSVRYHFAAEAPRVDGELERFGRRVPMELEPLVAENDFRSNLPRLEAFDGIGRRTDDVVHHPAYAAAGNLIYGTGMMEKVSRPGGMLESLALFFLSCHAGEAGHNCPVACTAGVLRVLQKFPDVPGRDAYWKRLIDPSYETNDTGAQFVTEVQGGSDVALNAAVAERGGDGEWRIRGEKWFCSNANADLILMTARHDPSTPGTRGLGLFLVPARLPDGGRNHYTIRRLKEKIGTRTMASAEIDFHGARAHPVGDLRKGFKTLMENVLHLSRIFNTFAALGIGRRAYQIADAYARHRVAFDRPVIDYPLVRESLARIRAENTAMLAAAAATVRLQDRWDTGRDTGSEASLLLRLLANGNKYLSALWTVDHVHHSVDVLAGNGAIESFSALPRLLRDSIVIENWEGTHNTLRMQILRDLGKYRIGEIYLDYMDRQLDDHCKERRWAKRFRDRLEALRGNLAEMKDLDPELASLRIRAVVDDMAVLFCAVHLYREAVHQEAEDGSRSKRLCLEYFMLLHLTERKPALDKSYLRMIAAAAAGGAPER